MIKIKNQFRSGFLASMLVIASFLLLAPSAYAQSAEEAAIKTLCEAETRAWLSKDVATYKNCWELRPYTRVVGTGEDGQIMNLAAEQLKTVNADVMGGAVTFANSNYQIHVEGNTAWATYDSVKTDDKGKTHPSYEFRLLEKIGGAWKIVGMSVHHYKSK
jgi:SnoaL-like domain